MIAAELCARRGRGTYGASREHGMEEASKNLPREDYIIWFAEMIALVLLFICVDNRFSCSIAFLLPSWARRGKEVVSVPCSFNIEAARSHVWRCCE